MADKPIIFSGPMVKALLDGRKTQTRRVLNPQPYQEPDGRWRWDYRKSAGVISPTPHSSFVMHAPYAPGDRLWVQEAHYLTDNGDEEYAVYAVDTDAVAAHRARVAALRADFPENLKRAHLRLRPSIHMPRWASRITLIVESVKVERLNEILEEDAEAEGVETRPYGHFASYSDTPRPFGGAAPTVLARGGVVSASARHSFATLWNSLHGPNAWDANPWVVVPMWKPEGTIRGNIDRIPVETGGRDDGSA